MSVNTKMTALADEIREISGETGKLGIDAMTTKVSEANDQVAEIESLISELDAALDGKSVSGGSGAAVETCTVTLVQGGPIAAPSDYMWYTDENGVTKKATWEIGSSYTIMKNSLMYLYNFYGSTTVANAEYIAYYGDSFLYYITGDAALTSSY